MSCAQPINHEQTPQTNHLLMAWSSHEFLMAFVLFNSADHMEEIQTSYRKGWGKKHSISLGNIVLPDKQPTSIDEKGCEGKDKGKVRSGECVQVCKSTSSGLCFRFTSFLHEESCFCSFARFIVLNEVKCNLYKYLKPEEKVKSDQITFAVRSKDTQTTTSCARMFRSQNRTQ